MDLVLLWIASGDSQGFVLEFMLRLESVGRLRNFQVLQGKFGYVTLACYCHKRLLPYERQQ
jgi:hypothetical protein